MKSISRESGRFDRFLGAIASLLAILTFFGVTGVSDLRPQLARLSSKLAVTSGSPSSTVKEYLASRFGGEAERAWDLLGTKARQDDWEEDFDTFKATVRRDSTCAWELHDIRDINTDELRADVYVHRTVASGAQCDKVSTRALTYRLARASPESAWAIVGASGTQIRTESESRLVKIFKRLLSPRQETAGVEFSPVQCLAQLRQLGNDNQKIELLRISLRGIAGDLPAQFLEEVLKELSFDSHRLVALKLLRPYIATPTPKEVTAVSDLFAFGSYKIEAVTVLQ